MSDVIQKCISANNFKNNGILVAVTEGGQKESRTRGIEQIISSGVISAKYDIRFDDKTYYTT